MICKNCNAEYADTLLKCPYCGSENEGAVEEKKEDILESYDDEARGIIKEAEKYPKKRANQFAGKMVVIVIAVAVIAAIILLVALFSNRNKGRKELGIREQHIKKMDVLLIERDYEGLTAYMDNNDLSYQYDKFYEVYKMYAGLTGINRQVSNIGGYKGEPTNTREQWEEYVAWSVGFIVKDACDVMRYYNKYAYDTHFLGNEDILEELYEEMLSVMKCFGISYEELAVLKTGEESAEREAVDKKLLDYFWELTK